MTDQAIQFYHNLLISMSSADLAEMKDNFLKSLRNNKACYGDRLLTSYLRPKFLTPEQMFKIRQVCMTLRNIVVKVKDAYFKDKKIAEDVALTETESMLANIDPGFSRICVVSRWDSFWSEDGLKFVELNAENPAGVAYSDIMSQVFLDLPVLKSFSKKYQLESFHIREVLLHAILVTYQKWQGNKSNRVVPNIAIVDWKDVPTFSEFELLQEYFELHGVPTVIADPRELDFQNGRLMKDDFEIDIVFRRVLTQEFIEKLDEVQPMLEAYRQQRVCMINSFRTKLLHKKSLFAIFSDTQNRNYFSSTEQQVIDEHIPWTRIIRHEKVDFHGEKIDLLDYVSQNKNNFVIKPNDEYGGKGVVIGGEASQHEWENVLEAALSDKYVVQEKVKLSKETFPYYDEGLKFEDLVVDLDPYLFGVNTAGCMTRLSQTSLANVTSGGGVNATFIIREKN